MTTLTRVPADRRQPRLADVEQVRLCVAAALVVVAVTVCHVLHAPPSVGTVVVGLLVVSSAAPLAVRHLLAVAAVGWA